MERPSIVGGRFFCRGLLAVKRIEARVRAL